MNTPRSFRLALSQALLGSVFLSSAVFGQSAAELDALRAKADRGNAIAQYNLGLAYANRNTPAYDPVLAYAWLSLAAANGTTGKALGQLTDALTPQQLEAGKRQLAALTTSPVAPAAAITSPVRPADEPAPASPSVPTPTVGADHDNDQKKLSAELAAAWKENELLRAGLTAQLADARKRIAIAEAALASKDKEIAALNTRLAEATARLDAPVAPVVPDASAAEIATLRAEREQLQTAATTAAAELSTLRSALEKAKAEHAALRGQLANAETGVSEARRAQALAEAEVASLRAAADRSSAERLAVAAQLDAANAELAAAKEVAAKASVARVTPAEPAEPAEPNPRVAALETERDRLAASVKSLSQERDALTAQLAAATAAVPADPAPAIVAAPIPPAPTAPEAQTAETSAKLAELEQAKADTDTKLEAALRSFTLQQGEIDRLQKALASIDEERAATATRLDSANAELKTLRPQAAAAAARAEELASLRVQLASANETVANQASALEAANRNLVDARRAVDTATTELVTTRDQLRHTQAQSAAAANEVHQLKTRLALAGSLPAATTPSRPGSPSTALPAPAVSVPPPIPAAPAPSPAVETPAGPRVHTVASGDSLSRISKQYYGTASRWNEILQANRDVIRNPDSLTLGTQLRIP